MANCEACNDLINNSADFASNGVTTAVCNSLKNDTGFSTSNNHNDCTDLGLANDCLIGNLDEELDAYEVCNIKDFLHIYVQNSYQVIKAMICAICGIWTNIHQLWDEVNALKARVSAIENYIENTLKPWINGVNAWRDAMNNWKDSIDTWKNVTVPATYLTKSDAEATYVRQDSSFVNNVTTAVNDNTASINKLNHNMSVARCYFTHMNENTGGVLHAYVDDDPTKAAINGFRKAAGITIRSGASAAPMSISVIGSTARITGSIQCDGNMPADYRSGGSSSAVSWLNFFNGGTEIETVAGNTSYHGNTPVGNLFLYEYKVNPCDFGFRNLYNASLFSADGGDFQCRIQTYTKGDKYPYDYGWGPNGEGDGQTWNDDRLLIQVRLVNVRTWGITRNNGRISPNGITMAIPCPSNWNCGSWQ